VKRSLLFLSKIRFENVLWEKIERVFEDPLDTLDAIARKRGCLMSGGHIDYNRIAVILLDEFRGGKIGNISLERVDDILDEEQEGEA
jgi:ribosome biogenesis GTPase A